MFDEGERERVAVREGERRVVARRRGAAPRGVAPPVARREVAEVDRAHERVPPRVAPPPRLRLLAPSEHRERVRRLLGEEALAEPRVERAERLVRVDEEDREASPKADR